MSLLLLCIIVNGAKGLNKVSPGSKANLCSVGNHFSHSGEVDQSGPYDMHEPKLVVIQR